MSPLRRCLLVLLLGTVLAATACAVPRTEGVVAPKVRDTSAHYYGAWQDRPYVLPAVTLTDRSGQRFNLHTSPSRPVTLVYFGYPDCPQQCAATLRGLATTLSGLTPDIGDDVVVVVIDIAAGTDKAERKRFHAWLDEIDPDFVGLTGPVDRVHGLARDLGVDVHRGPDGVLMHGDQVIAFDRDDAGVLVWTSDVPPAHIAADLVALVTAQR